MLAACELAGFPILTRQYVMISEASSSIAVFGCITVDDDASLDMTVW